MVTKPRDLHPRPGSAAAALALARLRTSALFKGPFDTLRVCQRHLGFAVNPIGRRPRQSLAAKVGPRVAARDPGPRPKTEATEGRPLRSEQLRVRRLGLRGRPLGGCLLALPPAEATRKFPKVALLRRDASCRWAARRRMAGCHHEAQPEGSGSTCKVKELRWGRCGREGAVLIVIFARVNPAVLASACVR